MGIEGTVTGWVTIGWGSKKKPKWQPKWQMRCFFYSSRRSTRGLFISPRVRSQIMLLAGDNYIKYMISLCFFYDFSYQIPTWKWLKIDFVLTPNITHFSSDAPLRDVKEFSYDKYDTNESLWLCLITLVFGLTIFLVLVPFWWCISSLYIFFQHTLLSDKHRCYEGYKHQINSKVSIPSS